MIGDRLSMLLLALVVVLGAVASWQWRVAAVQSTQIVAAAEQGAPLVEAPPPAPFSVPPPLVELAQTLERPLFTQTRRPPPVEPVTAVPTPQAPAPENLTPLAVELSAVILEADRQYALFRQAAKSSLLRAEVGQSVDGWLVSEIRDDGVSLKRGAERQELALRTFKAAPRPPTPRQAAAGRERPRTSARTGKEATPRTAEARPRRRPRRGPRRRAVQRQRRNSTNQ